MEVKMSEKAEWENYPVSEAEMGKRYKNWTENLARQMVLLYRVGREVGGDKFVERLKEEYYKEGQKGAKMWMSLTGTKPEDFKDCLPLAKIQDLIDDTFANFWDGYVEKSPKAIEKELTTCPVTKQWSKEPDLCAVCVTQSGVGMYEALNPKFKFKGFSKLLTKGDKVCRVRIEMED
jgi:hypothetical protein